MHPETHIIFYLLQKFVLVCQSPTETFPRTSLLNVLIFTFHIILNLSDFGVFARALFTCGLPGGYHQSGGTCGPEMMMIQFVRKNCLQDDSSCQKIFICMTSIQLCWPIPLIFFPFMRSVCNFAWV